jgi:hypothetical protein
MGPRGGDRRTQQISAAVARSIHPVPAPHDQDRGDETERSDPARNLEPLHPHERGREARIGDQALAPVVVVIERIAHRLRPIAGVSTGAVSCRRFCLRVQPEALNTAITENQIQPERIISVILQPTKHLTIGDYQAKYRVLYRL